MSKQVFQKVNLLAMILVCSLIGQAQIQYTQSVTTTNRNCNSGCSVIEIPALTNNPAAVIFATPVSGSTQNAHPVGAYYMYLNKWSIFNLDGTAIVVGAQYNLEYYVSPDANHFAYTVPPRINTTDLSYIDHAGMNNNPLAQIRVFPRSSTTNGALFNKLDVKVTYDVAAGKWYIANVNGTPIGAGCVYNVSFISGTQIITTIAPTTTTIIPTTTTVTPTNNSTVQPCNCPTSLPPNGLAGGDLVGPYPDPMVRKILGRFISNTPPAIGQILKWNGTEWAPANDDLGNPGTTTAAAMTKGYFRKCSGCVGADSKTSLEATHTYIISGITQDIVAEKNSRIMVSFSVYGLHTCSLCPPGRMEVTVLDNGTTVDGISLYFIVPGDASLPFTLSNYMFDVGPGNHKIEFKAKHFTNSSLIFVTGNYSSLLVIPL